MTGEIPKYRDLPVLGNGLPHSWDVFESAIDLGTANFLTADVVANATSTEVRSGERINVTLPLTLPDPPFFGRGAVRHTIHEPVPNVLDDFLDDFYLQSSSQWDGLRHRRDPDFGFFGGLSPDEAGPGGDRLGVDSWAQQGLIGRGVLVDVAAQLARRGDQYDPTTGVGISADLLEETLRAQGTQRLPGDILLVRTGYLDRYLAATRDGRRAIRDAGSSAGLSAGAEIAEYLWDSQCSAVAVDNPGVEVLPRTPDENLHARLIPMLGFPMGEFFTFGPLAKACEADGRYSCLFVSVPLNLPRGVGSPANAVVIR